MALEPIDVETHSKLIEDAYLSVVKGNDPEVSWLILSPTAQKQYTPQFTGSDFKEFLGSFEESKVQYGLARVCPPGSDVSKLLLIGWCPDSAPMKSRASFAANYGKVANSVLKGYHVQVTARDEDDLNERDLLMKISNAAGARYSAQQEGGVVKPTKTSSAPKPRPGSTAKPAFTSGLHSSRGSVGKSNVSKGSKDEADDWNEPEVEERDLEKNPVKPSKSVWKPIGQVDLKSVISEENSKPDPRLVNVVKSNSSGNKINPSDEISRLKSESKQKREYDYNQVLGSRSVSERKDSVRSTNDGPDSSASERKDDSKGEDKESSDDETQEQVKDVRSRFEKLAALGQPQIIKPKQFSEPSRPATTETTTSTTRTMKFGRALPGLQPPPESNVQDSSDEEEEREKEDEYVPSGSDEEKQEEPTGVNADSPEAPAPPPRRSVSKSSFEPSSDQASSKSANAEESEDEKEEESVRDRSPSQTSVKAAQPPPPPRRSAEAAAPAAPSAIAEYDYEAAEDNELTFEEGDLIINIQFVDDDWWLGQLKRTGEKGLFPSNYVELNK